MYSMSSTSYGEFDMSKKNESRAHRLASKFDSLAAKAKADLSKPAPESAIKKTTITGAVIGASMAAGALIFG